MAEQSIEIRISAKNLTANEFAKARADVAGLTNAVDGSVKSANLGSTSFKALGASIATGIGAALAVVTAAAAAIGALTMQIVALGKRGADVADIRNQFDTLNKSIGLDSKRSIDTLSKAVDGVVSKFDLMKITNKGLSAGLQVTDQDFKTLGEGARVLADRIGGDTKGAYEALTEALATGKTQRLAQIGLNIDETAAIRTHAHALGVDADQLSEHGKRTALQTALMRELTGVVQESGRAQIDFADAFEIAKTKFNDFVDDLALGIADSKVLGAMLKGIGAALESAFGGDHADLIKSIVSWIEKGALLLIEWSRTAISFGNVMGRVFGGVLTVLGAVGTTLSGIFTGMSSGVAKLLELAAQIPGIGDHLEPAARQAKEVANGFKLLTSDLAAGTRAAFEMGKGNGALFETLRKLDAGLASTRDRMLDALSATDDHTAATSTNESTVRRRADASSQVIQSLGQEAAAWDALIRKNREAVSATQDWLERGMKGFGVQKTQVLLESTGGLPLAPLMAPVTQSMPAIKPSILAGFKNLFSKDVPNTILAALTGGGNPLSSIGSLLGGKLGENVSAKFGSTISGVLGKTLGGAMNMFLPGIGSLVGPLTPR